MDFNINVKKIKIGASEENISKTIEELLELNKGIPARTNEDVSILTEKQLDESDYDNKKYRGEEEEITERQFGEREGAPETVVEDQFENADKNHGGHNPERSEVKSNENFTELAPIWYAVDKQIKDRKTTKMEKKTKK